MTAAALAFPGGLCDTSSFRDDEAPTETTLTPLPFLMLQLRPCSELWEPREDCGDCDNTGERTHWGDDGPSYSECSCVTETDYPAAGLCFEDGCLGPADACQHKPTDWDYGTGPTRGRPREELLRRDLEESESLLLLLTQRYPRGRWYHGAATALCEVTRAINDLRDYGFEDSFPTAEVTR